MKARPRYLVSLIVVAHGLVYLSSPFWSQSAGVFQNWKGTSALLGAGLGPDSLKATTSILWVAAGLGTVVAGVAIALVAMAPWLWRPTAIIGALFGVVSFALFFDGQGAQFVNEGGIGMLLSLVMIAGAGSFPQAFA